MSEFGKRALITIQQNPGITASDFALKMWPDNPMHTRTSNQGNGACQGKGAWLAAGSYLGKLRKQDLVQHGTDYRGFYLTAKGEQALKDLQGAG